MPRPGRWPYTAAAALFVALPALVLAACGDDDDESSKSSAASKPTTLSITTTDLGKRRFKMDAPKSIEGGLVKVSFTNAGKTPHEAQLIRLEGDHTVKEVLEKLRSGEEEIPDWVHFEGGVSTTRPGQTATATVRLIPGNYAVIDTGQDGPPPSAFGALAAVKVTGDNGGKVEDTATRIVGEDEGREKHEFTVSNLRPGKNELTFDNRGKEVHHVVGFPFRGNATLAEVEKALAEEGEPSGPPPVDFEKGFSTATVNGKRKLTTEVTLVKGRYALICFLTDRDGKGKSHFEDGMIEEVNVR